MFKPEIEAHQREAIMSTVEFRELFNSYDGLTPAQRLYGELGYSAVYVCVTPTERNMEYYDTTDRKKPNHTFDPSKSDWYPEVDFILEENDNVGAQVEALEEVPIICLSIAA